MPLPPVSLTMNVAGIGRRDLQCPAPSGGFTSRPPETPDRRSSASDLARAVFQPETLLRLPMDPPLGYTGPSGVLPTESQQSDHFVPIEDRWRLGLPRVGPLRQGPSARRRLPYMPGRWFDPVQPERPQG